MFRKKNFVPPAVPNTSHEERALAAVWKEYEWHVRNGFTHSLPTLLEQVDVLQARINAAQCSSDAFVGPPAPEGREFAPTTEEVRAAAARSIGGDWFDIWIRQYSEKVWDAGYRGSYGNPRVGTTDRLTSNPYKS